MWNQINQSTSTLAVCARFARGSDLFSVAVSTQSKNVCDGSLHSFKLVTESSKWVCTEARAQARTTLLCTSILSENALQRETREPRDWGQLKLARIDASVLGLGADQTATPRVSAI